jgi:hypothetical protein
MTTITVDDATASLFRSCGRPGEAPPGCITVDEATASLLRWVNQPVKILDQEGRWIGTFEPVGKTDRYHGIECPFTEEEIEQFQQQEGGRSLAEILADLEGRLRD